MWLTKLVKFMGDLRSLKMPNLAEDKVLISNKKFRHVQEDKI